MLSRLPESCCLRSFNEAWRDLPAVSAGRVDAVPSAAIVSTGWAITALGRVGGSSQTSPHHFVKDTALDPIGAMPGQELKENYAERVDIVAGAIGKGVRREPARGWHIPGSSTTCRCASESAAA